MITASSTLSLLQPLNSIGVCALATVLGHLSERAVWSCRRRSLRIWTSIDTPCATSMSFNNSFIVNILAENLDQDQGTPSPTVPHRQALASAPCLIQRLPPCSAFTTYLIHFIPTIHLRFLASRSGKQCKPAAILTFPRAIASG